MIAVLSANRSTIDCVVVVGMERLSSVPNAFIVPFLLFCFYSDLFSTVLSYKVVGILRVVQCVTICLQIQIEFFFFFFFWIGFYLFSLMPFNLRFATTEYNRKSTGIFFSTLPLCIFSRRPFLLFLICIFYRCFPFNTHHRYSIKMYLTIRITL